MLTGIIGFAAYLIAETSLVEPGARSGFMNMFFDDVESIITALFLIVSAMGAVIAIHALKDDKK